jgi:hypothetical protein
MHPYYFVAIFSSDPQRRWAALTGRGYDSAGKEMQGNGNLQQSAFHGVGQSEKKLIGTAQRKEDWHEKGDNCGGGSRGRDAPGSWHPPVAKTPIASNIYRGGKK